MTRSTEVLLLAIENWTAAHEVDETVNYDMLIDVMSSREDLVKHLVELVAGYNNLVSVLLVHLEIASGVKHKELLSSIALRMIQTDTEEN